jgi:signal transduction histidine kinase
MSDTSAPARILLVDDRESDRYALDEMLHPLGHEVVTVSSGEDALKAVLKGDFAVVLLDVRMPGMDGLETAAEMKRVSRSASIPIIFLTGDAQPERISLGYSLGAADYILKPVDPDALRGKVNAFVELYRARQELKEQTAALERELEEQRRLNESLDQFSGMVAHDLRNPLQVMTSVFEVLAGDGASDPATHDRVVTIGRRQANRAQELIESLLQLARASATPQPTAIDLTKLVTEVSDIVPALDVRTELKVTRFVADPVSIRQALINLLENASRYGSSGEGQNLVVMSAKRGPGGVILSVSDRGPGLSDEDAGTVFAPFKRGDEGIQHEGTGLGLAIVAAAARAHGGQAWYEPRPGGGATFRLLIPQKEDR